MRRIDTLNQLKEEKKRLQLKRKTLEAQIKSDFAEIKAGLEPAKLLSEGAKKALGSSDNHILGNSVGAVANMIAKSTLKNAGILPRILVPLLVKNVTGNLVENNKPKIMGWLNIISVRLRGKRIFNEQAG